MGWLWSGLGWVLPAAGLGVLVWALFWDRAGWRGRAALRCRGCWYDLTGAGGVAGEDGREDGRDRPAGSRLHQAVLCPECGKGHRTRGSMLRTRRRWKWAAAAVGLQIAAYGVVCVPAVRAGGAVKLVPSTAMAGVLAVWPEALPDAWWRGAMTELWRRSVSGDPTLADGWASRRLVFLLGRMTPVAGVTDQSTARGKLYFGFVNAVLKGDRAYGFERAWAQRATWVETVAREAVEPGDPVWAAVRMRRIVAGPYRVVVEGDQDGAWFVAAVRWHGGFGGSPPGFGPGMTGEQRADRMRGDRIEGVGPGVFPVRDHPAVLVHLGDAGVSSDGRVVELSKRLRVFAEPETGAASDGSGAPLAVVTASARVRAESGAGPRRVDGDDIRAELERALKAQLYQVAERKDGWSAALEVMLDDVAWLDGAVTLGGDAELGFWRGGAGGEWVALGRLGQGWWRVLPPEGPLSEGDDWWFRLGEMLLPAGWRTADRIEWVVPPGSDFDVEDPLVLRIGVGGNAAAYADLRAKRVLDGVVQLRTGLTVGRVQRYRATGRDWWEK